MDNVVYSVSPMQIYLMSFGMVAFIFALGAAGMGHAVFVKKQHILARLAVGAAGGFLVLVGIAMAVVNYRNLTTGVQTAEVRLDDKFIARDNCGDGGVCERHVLSLVSGLKYYTVGVNEDGYEKAQVGGCYRLTYYRGGGLMADSQASEYYEPISEVVKVERIDPALCE